MSVYFAQRENLIKIGWSRNVLDRVATLKAKLIGVIPGGRDVEVATHKRFKNLRSQGEWFRINEDLLTYIRDEAQGHEPDIESAQFGIRLPETFLNRIDDIAKRMSRPGMRVTRAEVLRSAAFRGVEQLEAETAKRK